MSVVVLDASSALTWCFEDDAAAGSDRLFTQVQQAGAVVPPLWHLEIASLLLSSERHRRLTQAESQAYLALLQRLPISTDVSAAERGRLDVFHLAREHGLTVYDAAYLDLAMRRQLPLATLDPELQRAARATGVSLIQL